MNNSVFLFKKDPGKAVPAKIPCLSGYVLNAGSFHLWDYCLFQREVK